MGAAALMLSVRIHDIWQGLSAASTTVGIGTELAAQPAGPGPGPAALPSTKPVAADGATAGQQPAVADGGVPASAVPGMSQAEMDVLQKLSERRRELDARARQLDSREVLLKAASAQIDRKVAELKNLETTINGLLKQYNAQEDKRIQSLVKIYENMKPQDAARIFEQLDMPILLEVVERMQEQKVAPILAQMDPAKAKNLTAALAQRRQLPVPQPVAPGAGSGG
jgi:flagellar motility protein MotE (MotC chaperone)